MSSSPKLGRPVMLQEGSVEPKRASTGQRLSSSQGSPGRATIGGTVSYPKNTIVGFVISRSRSIEGRPERAEGYAAKYTIEMGRVTSSTPRIPVYLLDSSSICDHGLGNHLKQLLRVICAA